MDKKFKIFVIVALVVLTMVASGAVFLVLTTRPPVEASGDVETVAPAREDLEIVYIEEAINANLKLGEDEIPHIMRLLIGVEIHTKDDDYKTFTSEFTTNQIIIRDSIIQIVRSTSYEEMMTETAQDDLAEKIVTSINELLDTKIVQDVYFKDFFVQ